MKNIFKTWVPCLVLALGLTGCYDEMDDKDVIDAKYALSNIPAVSMSAATANDHASATVTASISTVEGVVESGFMVAGSSDFAGAKTYIAEKAASISASVSGLSEMTTYYVKAFAFLADGRLVYSEPVTFTTLEAPSYELAGAYAAMDYDAETGEAASEAYEVTVELNGTEAKITNIWDGGETVVGTYDEATQTITVATQQLICVHPSYGDVNMVAVNDAISAYTEAVVFQFTPKGGLLVSSNWGAVCSAGTFGYYYVEMSHK